MRRRSIFPSRSWCCARHPDCSRWHRLMAWSLAPDWGNRRKHWHGWRKRSIVIAHWSSTPMRSIWSHSIQHWRIHFVNAMPALSWHSTPPKPRACWTPAPPPRNKTAWMQRCKSHSNSIAMSCWKMRAAFAVSRMEHVTWIPAATPRSAPRRDRRCFSRNDRRANRPRPESRTCIVAGRLSARRCGRPLGATTSWDGRNGGVGSDCWSAVVVEWMGYLRMLFIAA